MKTLKFKTNINCGGCIANVTPFLDNNQHIASWQVDTVNPQKILTVETPDSTAEDIVAIVQKAGYKAESLS